MIPDVPLKWVKHRFVDGDVAKIRAAACRVREVPTKHLCALSSELVRIHIPVGERTHHGHAVSGTSNRDIQASLATVEIQRPEAIEQPAVSCLAVPDREDDRVAFISLYALQVLDEEGLAPAFVEKGVEDIVFHPCAANGLGDSVGVLDAHGDHTE